METNTFKNLKNKKQDNFPEFIIIHHSAASQDQTVQEIEKYHLNLGWEGVGYQYLITKLGEVWKGRPEFYHGAHVSEKGMNKKSIGICLIGDFDKGLPTKAQEDNLVDLVKDIKTRYPNIKFAYHRDYATYKSCPGKQIHDDWLTLLLKHEESVVIPRKLLIELCKYL